MKAERPAATEYRPHFEPYISKVTESDIIPALVAQPAELRAALSGISEENAGHRYAEGKWSVRELIGHLIDGERVFGYRAMCIARGEEASLPGFEEDDYVANSGHDSRTLASLLDEFESLRRSHVFLFEHLTDEAATRLGTANGNPISARAIAFICVGHVRHHVGILKERYVGAFAG